MADLGLVATDVVAGDGQGRVMLELARRLVGDGHRVTVYSWRIDPELARIVRWRATRRPPGPRLAATLWFVLATTPRLRSARHDLVCLMGSCGLPRQPYVYYAQYSHRGWRWTWRASQPPPLRHRIHSAVHAMLERPLAARAERLIACHPGLAAELGVPMARTVVVPNGVDAADHRPATADERSAARSRLGLPADGFVVAFVGEYHTGRKGLEPLIRAVARGDEILVVAGSGDRHRMSAAAEAAGMSDRLHLVGFCDPRGLFAAADVAAVPSFYEPFSLVAAEAAASGLPLLLSTKAGAAAHLPAVPVEDPADVDQMRQALDRLRHDDALRRELAEAGPAAAAALAWDTVSARAADALLTARPSTAGKP